ADEAAPAEPDAEAVEAAPAGEPEVPHEWRDGNPHRQYVSPEYFEQKYAGATDEELLAAHEALGKELPHLMNAAAVAWMEAGGGESVVVPRPPPGEIEMGPGEKSYGLALTSRTRDAADGQLLKQSGLLPWEGNQSYYDRSDEQRWLGGELKRRGLPVPGYSSTLVKKQ
ncbi:MAG TPA: hypothetical protein VFD43_06620, partial [Planctomycetota bacterium]|nr:hypothetical protein [Planctomycetota bacterium]